MEQPTLFEAIINWTPFVVWTALGVYFVTRFNTYVRNRTRTDKQMLEALDRIASAIQEKRPD